MDAFVVVMKPSAQRASSKKQGTKITTSSRYSPYSKDRSRDPKSEGVGKVAKRKPLVASDGSAPSASLIRKHLLNTLSHESNPITHSDLYSRTDHVVSAATGHQRGEGRGGSSSEYFARRQSKLEQQLAPREGNILRNVRVFIDGYLANTTDIEMKRVVTQSGGEVLYSASGATHILTSQQLSGSKTHKLLTQKKMKIKPHVVKPEWVFDSIEAGKRVPERQYSILKSESTKTLFEMMGSK